jgi:hypothetical protein
MRPMLDANGEFANGMGLAGPDFAGTPEAASAAAK